MPSNLIQDFADFVEANPVFTVETEGAYVIRNIELLNCITGIRNLDQGFLTRQIQQNYGVSFNRSTQGFIIPAVKGATKPTTFIRQAINRFKKDIPKESNEVLYQAFHILDKLVNLKPPGKDDQTEIQRWMAANIEKQPTVRFKVHINKEWPTLRGMFGDPGSCYYWGQSYYWCSRAVQHYGWVIRIYEEHVSDEAILADPDNPLQVSEPVNSYHSHHDNDPFDEEDYRYYPNEEGRSERLYPDSKPGIYDGCLGRAWVMPLEMPSESLVLANLYANYDKIPHLNKESLARALGSLVDAKTVVKADCHHSQGLYINNSNGIVLSNKPAGTFCDFSIPAAVEKFYRLYENREMEKLRTWTPDDEGDALKKKSLPDGLDALDLRHSWETFNYTGPLSEEGVKFLLEHRNEAYALVGLLIDQDITDTIVYEDPKAQAWAYSVLKEDYTLFGPPESRSSFDEAARVYAPLLSQVLEEHNLWVAGIRTGVAIASSGVAIALRDRLRGVIAGEGIDGERGPLWHYARAQRFAAVPHKTGTADCLRDLNRTLVAKILERDTADDSENITSHKNVSAMHGDYWEDISPLFTHHSQEDLPQPQVLTGSWSSPSTDIGRMMRESITQTQTPPTQGHEFYPTMGNPLEAIGIITPPEENLQHDPTLDLTLDELLNRSVDERWQMLTAPCPDPLPGESCMDYSLDNFLDGPFHPTRVLASIESNSHIVTRWYYLRTSSISRHEDPRFIGRVYTAER